MILVKLFVLKPSIFRIVRIDPIFHRLSLGLASAWKSAQFLNFLPAVRQTPLKVFGTKEANCLRGGLGFIGFSLFLKLR